MSALKDALKRTIERAIREGAVNEARAINVGGSGSSRSVSSHQRVVQRNGKTIATEERHSVAIDGVEQEPSNNDHSA